ncbi:unnamed protein product [Paramecium sonneborni]|uniref:Transmembrane protein n=1 Tax=Paramecium sonneborni TaxID=65129 RepID=A0A8S1M211_9CILI|nr:unnamed protein product [Paramecium sonneborni]
MNISKYVILFCVLLINNAGFTTQNLSNKYQDVDYDFGIEQNNQISLIKQKQLNKYDQTLVDLQTQMIQNNNQELEDFNMLMQTNIKNVSSNALEQNVSEILNANEYQNLQDIQSKDLQQSQLLISEDYEVYDIVNPEEEVTQISQEKFSNVNPQINQGEDNYQNREESKIQEAVQNITENQKTFSNETGYISDSPLDINLSNNQEDIINSLSKKDDQLNYDNSTSNTINQTIDSSQNQYLKQKLPLKEYDDNINQNQMNNQDIEELSNKNQEQESLSNPQNTSQNNLNDYDNQGSSKDYQQQKTQDSLHQGYIIQNNVETDDYLKDIQNDEKSSVLQQNLQNKLQQEEEYLKQLKIIKQEDENQLKDIEEKEKFIRDSEQNEEQQIIQINKQLQIHENQLQEMVTQNENDQNFINNEQEINDQTQFRPYEGQELIISSEVNYDEGNIEQFENTEEMIVETYQKLYEQNDDYKQDNQDYQIKSEENFQQSDFSVGNQENTLDEKFDKSIPAEPQEISIDLNLTSETSQSKIYLSKDILIYANDQQKSDIKSGLPKIGQTQKANPEEKLTKYEDKENMNENLQNTLHVEQQNENKEVNNDLNEKVSSNIQDEKKQIINTELNNSYLREPQFDEKSQQNVNPQINLTQNNKQEFAQIQNFSSNIIIQSDNLLTFQVKKYQNQNQQFLNEQSFQQIQQQLTKNNLRGSKKSQSDFLSSIFVSQSMQTKQLILLRRQREHQQFL